MDFVAFDFETANSNRNSACAVGIVEVTNGIISRRFFSLIKPPSLKFHPSAIKTHGITPEMVENEKTFDEVYPQIREIMADKIIVAHKISFDMQVLEACINHYNVEFFDIRAGICSLTIAKEFLPLLKNHQLSTIAEFFQIDIKHHNALSDAESSALIMMRLFCNSRLSLSDILETEEDGKNAQHDETPKHKEVDIWAEDEKFDVVYKGHSQDANNRFFQKTIVFTNHSMKREGEYVAMIEKIGGYTKGHITKKVDFLVVAKDSFQYLHDEGKSTTKMRLALKYQSQGVPIQIISETEFLDSIDHDIIWKENP